MPAHSGVSCQGALPTRVVCQRHGSPSRGTARSISFAPRGRSVLLQYTNIEENVKFTSILRQTRCLENTLCPTVGTLPGPGDAFTLSCCSGALRRGSSRGLAGHVGGRVRTTTLLLRLEGCGECFQWSKGVRNGGSLV